MIPSIQSCKKKEEPKPSAKEIITKDSWTLVKIENYDASGNLISTNTHHNQWEFSPSGDYYFYNNQGELYEYGTWELKDRDSKIEFIDHNGIHNFTVDILELKDTVFTISLTYSNNAIRIFYLER